MKIVNNDTVVIGHCSVRLTGTCTAEATDTGAKTKLQHAPQHNVLLVSFGTLFLVLAHHFFLHCTRHLRVLEELHCEFAFALGD